MASLTASQRAEISSKTPIQFDPTTYEPFIPCRAPPPSSTSASHSRVPSPLIPSLRLTPPRPSDAEIICSTLNHITVWPQMRSLPYPFSMDDAALMIQTARSAADQLLLRFAEGDYSAAEGCPFSAIRATTEDGEEKWIGGIGVRRWPFDEEEGDVKVQKVKEMMARSTGDKELVRTMGFYLDPIYQGQGLMRVVMHTLLNEYLVPICQAHKIRATVYNGNWISRKAFERAGFVMAKTNWVNSGPSRGGLMKEEWWMEWTKPEDEKP